MSEVEQKLDELFCNAFETNHPAMLDWVNIKFELKELRAQLAKAQKEAYPAYKREKALRCKAENELAEARKEIEMLNISLELQADRVDKLIDENVKAEAENAALRERLKGVEEAKEYKDYEFCKDVECGAFDNGRCYARQCCYRTAKHFHRWLKQNGYKIIKSVRKKGE